MPSFRLKLFARQQLRAMLVVALCFASAPGLEGAAQAAEPGAGEPFLAAFESPPPAARPWVFWYWMHGCVSREGIDADLDAMVAAGIGGAYLMPIKGPLPDSPWPRPVEQLTPEWWKLIRHALAAADRRGLQIAMHVCDGFATAGGPWVTPETSMQKLTWSTTIVDAATAQTECELPQPAMNEGFYRDVAVFAVPLDEHAGRTSATERPHVTTSVNGVDASFLAGGDRSGSRLRIEDRGWIQYEFAEPFLCRSITIVPDGANSQAQRLLVEASDDGRTFRRVAQLAPPRHGWQNGDGAVTHAVPATTARWFRFTWDKEGTEPGGEDLDSAKWSPVLKVRTIELSSVSRIHQSESKNGSVWRVSPRSVEIDSAPAAGNMVDLTDSFDGRKLAWKPATGVWIVLRLGCTSTGAHNETGGAGRGLECDKLNAAAVERQFHQWFGKALDVAGPELAGRTLSTLHVDSWECGGQNWTPGLLAEFTQRRGYAPRSFLPALAGYPVKSADKSERFLHDWRLTLNELLQERFFGTLARLAREHGVQFSAECTAPTFPARGMEHFAAVDVPMGEFWFRSPTHDKPSDMLDAISAAHVYGKPIAQAEAFTQLRMEWDERPALLKPLADRQFAVGANRLVFHVTAHNPWLDRAPGVTLDNIGLLFQRGQTWWPLARAWTDYVAHCQAVLQCGAPVADVAVFTGEELPSRAVLPEQLIDAVPGLIGAARVLAEQRRRTAGGAEPVEGPPGVRHVANMVSATDWIDPLRGLAYDSLGPEALLTLCRVEEGRVALPGGASYAVLVVPGSRPAQPAGALMSVAVAKKLLELVRAGGTVVLCERPMHTPGLSTALSDDDVKLAAIVDQLWPGVPPDSTGPRQGTFLRKVGQGRVVCGPLTLAAVRLLGLPRDATFHDAAGRSLAGKIAWAHRRAAGSDGYFVANQTDEALEFTARLRASVTALEQGPGGRASRPWQLNPVTGERSAVVLPAGDGSLPLQLEPYGCRFIVMASGDDAAPTRQPRKVDGIALDGPWRVRFDPKRGGPPDELAFRELVDWTRRPEPGVRYYAGAARYATMFRWDAQASPGKRRMWLDLGRVENLARVSLNGTECGVAWTEPYRVEITSALRPGENELAIDVYNTWKNRLVGDAHSGGKPIAWTTARPPATDAELLPAGLLGPVTIWSE